MIKKYIIAAYSIIIAICIIGDVSAAPLKRTQSSIVIDAATGKVISSSNADEKRYPASLTKLMTLYIAFDALDKGKLKLSDNLKVSRRAANQVPSKIGVVAGSTIKAKDVINALIVKSANDCAVVLAEHLGKTEENFAKIMTKTAKELGMKHTTFKNASGLHHSQQKTTARDMAILGSAIYHHFPEYYDLFSTKNFTYKGKTYKTHNHLLKNYTGADGMKTGYTYLAGYNIVTSAQRNNNRVIAVTMGHNSIKNRDYKVAQLMNTGFSKLNNSYQYRAIANLDITQTTSDLLTSNNQNNLWGIQVGAFSNYAKARSYALGIQNQLKPDYASKTSVHVEPFSKGYTVVYRSQLIGLKKNEADKSCNQLKHKNKSCMVVSIEPKTQFAMANQ